MKNRNNYNEIIPYPELRGMDPDNEGGVAYLENMYIDYGGDSDALESIVGYRRAAKFKEVIHSFCLIGSGDEAAIIIHSGGGLYFGLVKERNVGLPLKKIFSLRDCESITMPLGRLCLISDGESLISVNTEGVAGLISNREELVGCRCATLYEDRIFLSGNPLYEGIIYYSEPVFQGEIVFDKRITTKAEGNILSLIAYDGRLTVFSEGCIVCHSSDGEGYPIVRIINRQGIHSNALMLGRELIFMTDGGLTSLYMPGKDGEVVIKYHSEKMNRLLSSEDRRRIKLQLWLGYIVIFYGEKIYLADPREKNGYGWYLIRQVGGYENDRRVYRYRSYADKGCRVHPKPNEKAVGEIYSYGKEDGSLAYYSVEGDKRYSVYPTQELQGGIFHPAGKLCCLDGLMWFCAHNAIYLFNNDMRGASPQTEPCVSSTDVEEYFTKDRIHPYYYSFAGHAARCVVITRPREQLPTRESGRLTSSVSLRLKTLSDGEIRLVEATDGIKTSDRKISLKKLRQQAEERIGIKSETDTVGSSPAESEHCSTKHFSTVCLPDRARAGERMQLCILTDSFASPFGIDRIEYRPGKTDNKSQKKGN